MTFKLDEWNVIRNALNTYLTECDQTIEKWALEGREARMTIKEKRIILDILKKLDEKPI